jgi:hypothetical protein
MHGAARHELPDAVPTVGRNDAVVASVGIALKDGLASRERLLGIFGRPRGGILVQEGALRLGKIPAGVKGMADVDPKMSRLVPPVADGSRAVRWVSSRVMRSDDNTMLSIRRMSGDNSPWPRSSQRLRVRTGRSTPARFYTLRLR